MHNELKTRRSMRKVSTIGSMILLFGLTLPTINYVLSDPSRLSLDLLWTFLQGMKYGFEGTIESWRESFRHWLENPRVDLSFNFVLYDSSILTGVVAISLLFAAVLGFVGTWREKRFALLLAGILSGASAFFYSFGASLGYFWRGPTTFLTVDYYIAAASILLLVDAFIVSKPQAGTEPKIKLTGEAARLAVRKDASGYYDKKALTKVLGDKSSAIMASAGAIKSAGEKARVVSVPTLSERNAAELFLDNSLNWSDRGERWVDLKVFRVFLESYSSRDVEALLDYMEKEHVIEFDATRKRLRSRRGGEVDRVFNIVR